MLIENRQPINYDRTLPKGGLAIYHIDENRKVSTVQGFPGQASWYVLKSWHHILPLPSIYTHVTSYIATISFTNVTIYHFHRIVVLGHKMETTIA